jgi:tryptophan 2,3-dioxygenase
MTASSESPPRAPNPHAGLTYNSYLRVDELLAIQTPLVPERSHDELLFITIHQAYELWFKQILFELDTVARHIEAANLAEARRLVDRVSTITRVLVDQIHILETMTPRDFCHFRSALAPASGFQSAQFRELEFLMGLKEPNYLRSFPPGTSARARLDARLAAPSLRDGIHTLLRKAGFVVADDIDTNPEAFEASVRSLLPVYAEPEAHRDLHDLCEAVVALDQWVAIWRFHHVRVVERVIGSKHGTGGSPGVKYLDSTTTRRAFPLLWAVRSYLDEHELFAAYRGP